MAGPAFVRPLAPHVQAAMAAVQPKMPETVGEGRPVGAHVQRAVAGAMQAKVQPSVGGGPQVAAHVQAAIARGQGLGGHPAPQVQRAIPAPLAQAVIAPNAASLTAGSPRSTTEDAPLEKEAARMGEQALQQSCGQPVNGGGNQARPGGSEGVIQTIRKYKAGRWYSRRNPYKVFPTKVSATAYDKKLRLRGRDRFGARVPTLYTYTHTRPTRRITSVPQGPHTIAHRVILEALLKAKTVDKVKGIFDDQVLTPKDVEEVVLVDEAPPSGYSSQMLYRLQRYLSDYRKYYKLAMMQFAKPKPSKFWAKHYTNLLLNMDPYATYGWKSMTGASKKALKAKSESKVSPVFSDLYDKPKAGVFVNVDALESLVEAREKLFDFGFK